MADPTQPENGHDPANAASAYAVRKRQEFPEGREVTYHRSGHPRDGQRVVIGAQGEWVREAVFVRFADGCELFVGWEDLRTGANDGSAG